MADPAFLDDAPPDDLVEVGRVAAAHGVRGWLKIQPYSPQADALLGAPVWWLKAPDPVAGSGALPRPRGLRIRACRRQAGQFLAAQADGIADRDTAESLRGYTVWVPRAAFPSAGDDEYYWIDLIGCDFHGMGDDGPRLLGRVDQVLDNGAHAVLQVALGAPDAEGRRPRLARIDGTAVGSALAGFAGAVMAPIMSVDPQMGVGFLIPSFLSVLVGGVNSLVGALIGSGVIGGATTIFSAGISQADAQILVFLLAMIIIRFLPNGITGGRK